MSRSIVEVPFFAESVQAVKDGEAVWVVVKRVCEALDIDHDSQRQKLASKAWAVTVLITATGPDGKNYESFCVSLDSLPMWLATIDANRVKPEARFKLVAYQKECARVLRDHFFGAPAATGQLAELLAVVRSLAETVGALAARMGKIENNQAALWSHISSGGYIAPARFDQLWRERETLADVELALGKWKDRRSAKAGITRDMRESTDWGGAGKPWARMPAALEPAVRAVLDRRMKDVTRGSKTKSQQLSLIKTG